MLLALLSWKFFKDNGTDDCAARWKMPSIFFVSNFFSTLLSKMVSSKILAVKMCEKKKLKNFLVKKSAWNLSQNSNFARLGCYEKPKQIGLRQLVEICIISEYANIFLTLILSYQKKTTCALSYSTRIVSWRYLSLKIATVFLLFFLVFVLIWDIPC